MHELSHEPETTCVPSCEIATDVTGAECPASTCSIPFIPAFQIQTDWLSKPETRHVPSSKIVTDCQGMTSFPLQSHLRVFPTLTSDTFGILWTPTASQFQKSFGVLPTPSAFQRSPTLPHAPSTPAPHPIPPLKVTWRSLPTPHPPIQTPLQHSPDTLGVVAEIEQPPQHPILRVTSLE